MQAKSGWRFEDVHQLVRKSLSSEKVRQLHGKKFVVKLQKKIFFVNFVGAPHNLENTVSVCGKRNANGCNGCYSWKMCHKSNYFYTRLSARAAVTQIRLMNVQEAACHEAAAVAGGLDAYLSDTPRTHRHRL